MNIVQTKAIQARIAELSADLGDVGDEPEKSPIFKAGYISALEWVNTITARAPTKALTTAKAITLNPIQLTALQAALDNDNYTWKNIHGKTTNSFMIVKNHFVEMVGKYPKVTEAGAAIALSHGLKRSEEATDIPEDALVEAVVSVKTKKTKPSIPLTGDQKLALQAAIDHDNKTWSKLSGRTISSIGVKRQLTIMFDVYPALTEYGEKIAAEYGITKSDRYIDIPSELQAIPIVKRHHWTEKKIAAFKAVAKGDMDAWLALPQRTRKVMISSQWVIVKDSFPDITTEGRMMAVMNGINPNDFKKVEVIESEPVGQLVGVVA